MGVGDVLNMTVRDHPELMTAEDQLRSVGEAGVAVHADGAKLYPLAIVSRNMKPKRMAVQSASPREVLWA